MVLLLAILLAAGGVLAALLLAVGLGAIYYDLTRTKLPPEFDHPLKLRVVHCGFIMTLMAGKICEFLGICRTLDAVRFVLRFWTFRLDPSLVAKDLLFDGVPVRVYQPKAPSAGRRKGMLLFHGGAGVAGTIDCYQNICNRITKGADVVLVSVGYGLSPEHPYPSQYKQCLAATVHFLQNAETYGVDPSQVVIFGDSAGGNFTSVVAQQLTKRGDLPKLRAQALIYGGFQAMDFQLPSYLQNSSMPFLTQENTVIFGLNYFNKDPALKEDVLRGSHVPDDFRLKYRKWVNADNIPQKFKRGYREVPLAPYKPEVYEKFPELMDLTFSSLFAEDHVIRQLPETLFVTCEHEVFRDDSLLYMKRLEDCGVKVRWFHSKQGFHGVMNFIDVGILSFPAGVEIVNCIIDFVESL